MTRVFRLTLLPMLAGFLTLPAFAQQGVEEQEADPLDAALAIQGGAVLTQGEIDALFSKIPDIHRLAYIRNGERVNQVVASQLRYKLLAAEAKAAGLDQDPLVRRLLSLAAEKELAETWLAKVVEEAPEADYEALAREYFLAHPDEFLSEDAVDVTHILVSKEDRSPEDALQLALALREQALQDPARFNELVVEHSDDPSKATNQGRFPKMRRGQMVKPFEDAAFSMGSPGEISEPVETTYGYHLIRLNAKWPPEPIPFEDVKAGLVEREKNRYLSAYRSRYLKSLQSDPIELPDGAVEAMVKRHFGENLELAPAYPE